MTPIDVDSTLRKNHERHLQPHDKMESNWRTKNGNEAEDYMVVGVNLKSLATGFVKTAKKVKNIEVWKKCLGNQI